MCVPCALLRAPPHHLRFEQVLPEEFYVNGTGGVRKRTGLPLMLYFPAPCVSAVNVRAITALIREPFLPPWHGQLDNVWNEGGRYRWAEGTQGSNFLVPIADDSYKFWSDVFAYGEMLASKGVEDEEDPWPGQWLPPMVKEGWKGTNLAAYETDFYHNIVSKVPEFRSVFGAGEQFLRGIHDACADRGMTAQVRVSCSYLFSCCCY